MTASVIGDVEGLLECNTFYIVTVLEQYVDVMGLLECNTFF